MGRLGLYSDYTRPVTTFYEKSEEFCWAAEGCVETAEPNSGPKIPLTGSASRAKCSSTHELHCCGLFNLEIFASRL